MAVATSFGHARVASSSRVPACWNFMASAYCRTAEFGACGDDSQNLVTLEWRRAGFGFIAAALLKIGGFGVNG